MASKGPIKDFIQKRKDKRKAKELNTTAGLKCLGPNCGKPTKVKKQKTSKKKRQGREQRLYVASESETSQHPTTSRQQTPGMDVTHQVIESGKPTKSTDYTPDNTAENLAKVESIGGKVTSFVSDPTAEGIEETTHGGLKRDYYSKGLYKKAKSGDVHKIKGYSTYSEGGHQKELIKTSRGGDVAMFRSTEGMTKEEERMHKKSARKPGGSGVRYISEERLGRKTDRTSKRLNKRKGKVGILSRDKTREKFLGQAHL